MYRPYVVTLPSARTHLPPGKEESLFESFTGGVDERSAGGVGLGLASVRAGVEAHKGTVRAEHCPEGGTRFIFTLPAGVPPDTPMEA